MPKPQKKLLTLELKVVIKTYIIRYIKSGATAVQKY